MRKLAAGIMVLLLLTLCFLTGCWDQRDINNLAIITLLCFDRITQNGENLWQVSALVMNPGAGEKDTQNGKKESAPEGQWVATGVTIQDAIRNFTKRSPRFVFFGHTVAVILGERAAQEKTKEIIELGERYRESRPRIKILTASGEAYRLIEAEPEIARTNSEEISEMVERTVEPMGLSVKTTMTEFSADLVSQDRDAVAPRIKSAYIKDGKVKEGEKPTTPIVEGMGVFSDGKLAGWLNQQDTLGYLLITRKIVRGEIPIVVDIDGTKISYLLGKSKCKVRTSLQGEALYVSVNIKASGAIVESQGVNVSPENLRNLEEEICGRIKEIVLGTITRTQQLNSDCLGFSQNLRRFHPKQWKQIQADWRGAFTRANVEVIVESKIANIGRLAEEY